MFPSRGPANEHKLARIGHCLGQRKSTRHRTRGEQIVTQTPVPEERVSAWSKHYTNNCHCLLLCKHSKISYISVVNFSVNSVSILNSLKNQISLITLLFSFFFSRIYSSYNWYTVQVCGRCCKACYGNGCCQLNIASLKVSTKFQLDI